MAVSLRVTDLHEKTKNERWKIPALALKEGLIGDIKVCKFTARKLLIFGTGKSSVFGESLKQCESSEATSRAVRTIKFETIYFH
ncbi:MAG: hypothetical protein QOH71_1745 [Blastocatellia bacterium]|nr:hypothetical protein [Blastocatellia bacterium]